MTGSDYWSEEMTKAIEMPPGIDETDMKALNLAFARFYSGGKAQADQLDWMVKDQGWLKAAMFAASCCQRDALRLKPWQSPPCWVADENEPRVGEEDAARLLRRMLKAGISEFHPDPMAALEKAK
jgi:hypothetical protein